MDGQLGLEATPEEYVEKMTAVFREVRRVLRSDGTLWLNIGDSYNAYNGNRGSSTSFQAATEEACPSLPSGYGLTCKSLKPKDLVGVPWMLAFALRADGWWLRSEVIWHKPNPMPESVTDRPTKSHEQVFLLAKSPRYFFDAEAVREDSKPETEGRYKYQFAGSKREAIREQGIRIRGTPESFEYRNGRNVRSVWTIPTAPYPKAHFATFPPALAERCILAGTSAEGCCSACGAPWQRVVEKSGGTIGKSWHNHESDLERGQRGGDGKNEAAEGWKTYQIKTLGWRPTCDCNASTEPCTVLDPFVGSGTTLYVARQNGCQAIGIELNEAYCRLVIDRLKQRTLL